MAKVSKEDELVEFNKVRQMVRNELVKKYGGISKFLHSEKGKEMGGMKIKIYLFDTGPVNYTVISTLCEYLGLGTLTRKICFVRSVTYRLRPNVHDTEKTPCNA